VIEGEGLGGLTPRLTVNDSVEGLFHLFAPLAKFMPYLSCKGYRVPPNEPIPRRKPSAGGSKTPVRSAEEIHLGNFFRRQNASAGRIHRSIPLMGGSESGWKEGVEEINSHIPAADQGHEF